MASMKLPPRQKMINMMYLVLTAMLALNVSKEVLDSFAIMDGDLVRSSRAHEKRSDLDHQTFADAAKRFPEKFGAPHQRALQVKAQADSLIEQIQLIKTNAIAAADGLEPTALRAPDTTGRDTLRSLIALEAKDDRTTLTRMLVGSDPAMPRTDQGSAYDLKQSIAAFRDRLKGIAGDRNKDLTASLDLLFDLGDRRDASGTMNNWEAFNFYDVPLVAGIATFSKLQADVRSAENDIVKWLYRSVEEADYKFGTLTTAVIPQNNLIMQGDSFRADVFLAAYDPRNPPQVQLTNGSDLPIGSDGKAKLRLIGNEIGEHAIEGVIRFEGPMGMEEIPYSTKYQVMAPLLVASPTKMNVLYRGVENPIDISVPGVPADRVQAVSSVGRMERRGSAWVVKDLTGATTAEISAMVSMPDGSSRRVGPLGFRVKDLPPPAGYVGGKGATDKIIRKSELIAAQGIVARLEDSPFNELYKVKRYELTVVRRDGSMNTLPVIGNSFTPQARTVLESVRPNERVIFEEIRAKLANDQGREVELPNITLKVIQ